MKKMESKYVHSEDDSSSVAGLNRIRDYGRLWASLSKDVHYEAVTEPISFALVGRNGAHAEGRVRSFANALIGRGVINASAVVSA